MTSSNGKHFSPPVDAPADSERSLTPEIIRLYVRARVMRRHTFNADEHATVLRRRHTHIEQNGHAGHMMFPGEHNWPQNMRTSRRTNSLIRICVGGEEFITTRETIMHMDNSRLASMLQDDRYYNSELGMYFFDRSPEVFRAVLECHRHGTLHLPGHLCGNDLDNELKFWGISMDRVAKCCVNKITVGRAEAEVYKNVEYEFSSEFEDLLIESFRESGYKSIKLKTYLFLEYPSFSRWASYWSTFFATLIIVSTLNVALMSHEVGRQKRKDVLMTENNDMMNLVNTSKWKKLWTTEVDDRLYFFDLALVTLFTIEMVIRFATGPNKLLFFKSWINVVDLATIIMYWIKFMLSIIGKNIASGNDKVRIEIAVFLFTEFQFLRMFRILKLARNFTGLRVLILVLKNSRHELVTLIVFIIVGMFFFSFVIYVVEIYRKGTFSSVPLAFWWSIVTMTTVGYGDAYPTGAPGMVVGALCAVAGMIISGLSIPILSNNFNVYYNTLEYQLRVQEERIAELKALENDIKHATKLDDIDGKNLEDQNGQLPLPLDEEARHGIAMPQDGDVTYKSASDPTTRDIKEYLPEVDFKSEIRRSVRSDKSNHYDVIDVKPIPESINEYTDDTNYKEENELNKNDIIPYENDSVIDVESVDLPIDDEDNQDNDVKPTLGTEQDIMNLTDNEDATTETENIYAEPCWQPTSDVESQENVPNNDNTELVDYNPETPHAEENQTTNFIDVSANNPEQESPQRAQPPLPMISQDVFVEGCKSKSDMIESDSETHEFMI